MSALTLIVSALAILTCCIAFVVWLNRTVARICKEDEQHDPY